jgi:hypothetical protein
MAHHISRREVLIRAGKGLAGAALLASPLRAQYVTVGQKLIDGSAVHGTKPLFLPPPDSTDPAVHSLAENLFWTDILAEHASLLALLMPEPELAARRSKAEQFQRNFAAQFDRARAVILDHANFAALNQSTVELIKPLIEFERSLLQEQTSGTIHTLIWPTFYEHTIGEAEHAIARLEKLAAGTVALNAKEVIAFWSGMMSDHCEFIAHLLDPKEGDLISTALDSAAQFKGFQQNVDAKEFRGVDVLIAADELLEFESAIESGVQTGTIRSIIPLLLADHVRRETLKFIDELKRVGFRT